MSQYTSSVALLLSALALAGCPEFVDGRPSLLKKSRFLAITFEPPEAAPGETVTASFLVADQRGAFRARLGFWLPLDLRSGLESVPEALQRMGLSMAEIQTDRLQFRVPPAESYAFDAQGLARQPFSTLVQLGNLSAGDSMERVLADLPRLLQDGTLKLGTRTFLVSTRPQKNRNPRLASVVARPEAGGETVLGLVRSDDLDQDRARQYAAAHPLLLPEGSACVFQARWLQDPAADTVAYQWITTGGELESPQSPEVRWTSPGYRSIGEGEQDLTGLSSGNPRVDPNLYPVWLVVRDDVDQTRLGQSWIEFYLRVVPKL